MTSAEPAAGPRTSVAVAIASLAALLSTMLGIGGGLVMVPLLTLFARMPIKRTTGTSLAVIFLVICVGVVAQEIRQPGDIHWHISIVLAAGALAGTFIGKWLNKRLPERVFRYAFCVLLVVAAARLVGLWPDAEPLLGTEASLREPLVLVYLGVVGLFAGIVAALFGVGGGVVVVPALALAWGMYQTDFAAARATSLGMILPTSLVAAWLHWRAGNVDLRLVGRMAPPALGFAVAGVLVAYAVPGATLRVIFGVLLLAAAVRLALQKVSKKS